MKGLRRTGRLAVVGLWLAPTLLFAQISSPDLAKHLQAAQTALDAGNYPQAAQELRTAIAIQPELRGAYYQLGYALFELHQSSEAEKAFKKELGFQPPDPYSLYYLGTIRSEAGQRQAAAAFFEKSLAAGEVLDVRQKLASNYLALNHLDEAIRFLETSIRSRPEDGSLHYLLGRAYKQEGKAVEAKAEFDTAARWKTKFRNEMISLDGLRQALQSSDRAYVTSRVRELYDSGDSDILLASATLLGQADLPDEASTFLKKVIDLNPAIAEAHFDLGRAYVALDKRQDALPELSKAAELKPDFYEAELLLGTLLADDGKNDEAIKHLRVAARIRDDNPRLLLLLALQYNQGKYFADSIDLLKKAIKLQPENPDPRYLLIESYYRNFEYEHALSCAQETVTRFPDSALAHYHLGMQFNNFSRLDDAKQQLDIALAKDASLVEARVILGDVMFKMGKPDASVACFRKVLAIDPQLMDAQAGLGKALIQLKQYGEAAAAMEEATRIDPKPAALHLYLSQAYRALGRPEEARKEAAVFTRLNQERANARDREADRKYPN
jgi:tetratricopeptide (TPR) repeat protein